MGAKLIETITAGLYDGNLNCLREYIQNSIDSKADRVDVYFENQTVLVIEDNGCGMNKQALEKSLHLGKSEKSSKDIGWRGIGIWSGVPACRKIVIITKKRNHPKLRVEIDAEKLRQQYNLTNSATKVLTAVTGDIEEYELGNEETIQDSHFTIVRLEEMLPNQRTIFTEDEITKYLSRNVPVPFNTEKFTMGKKINKKLLANDVELNEIVVFLNKKQQIFRPPYNDNLFFGEIIEKKFIVKNEFVAYGWLLSSKINRQLNLTNRGVYFKKKGMTIGNENLVSKQHKKTYNQWQYGEIHIVTSSLKENAPRNNFEANSDLLIPFYDQVGAFIGQLQSLNQYQSYTIVTKSIEKIKKLIEVDDIKTAKKKIIRLKKKLQINRAFPREPALQKMKEVIDNQATENKVSLRALEKQVKKIIKEKSPDSIKEKRDRLMEFIKTSYPSLKKHLQKTTKRGKMELNIDAMDPVKTLLQQKTGLTLDTICKLSRRAYDWKTVEKGDNGPILNLSGPYNDRHFGVMIYTLHHILVNLFKHEKGEPSFAFYESMTEEEKIETLTEFYMTQSLILRLIEKSKHV